MRAPPSAMPTRRARPTHGRQEHQALEALASEFALLAQRRARLERQLALLGRQAEAAAANLSRVERRMAALGPRMRLPAGDAPLPAALPGALPGALPRGLPRGLPSRAARGALLEY